MSNLGLFRWKSMVPNKTKECHISTILTIFQYLEPDAAWWIEEFWWYWFGIIFISLAQCNLRSFDFFHYILSYPFQTHLPKIQGPTHATSLTPINVFMTSMASCNQGRDTTCSSLSSLMSILKPFLKAFESYKDRSLPFVPFRFGRQKLNQKKRWKTNVTYN